MTKLQSSTANLNKVAEVTSTSWKNQVLESSLPVVVDFYATWCGPCQYVSPIITKLASEFNGAIKFVKLDIDKNENIADKYNIRSIPTIIIFKSGREVARTVGARSKEELKSIIQTSLSR
jgi:thioredoxin 1